MEIVLNPVAWGLWTRSISLDALRDINPDSLPPAYRRVLLAELSWREPRYFMHGGRAT